LLYVGYEVFKAFPLWLFHESPTLSACIRSRHLGCGLCIHRAYRTTMTVFRRPGSPRLGS
jgi:hypothetical protein